MKANLTVLPMVIALIALVQVFAFAKHSPIQSVGDLTCKPINNQTNLLPETFHKKTIKWSQKLNKRHNKGRKGLLCLSTVLLCALLAWLGSFIPVVGGIVAALVLLCGFGFLLSCILIKTLACMPVPYDIEEMDNN